jgi:hypothetical protein
VAVDDGEALEQQRTRARLRSAGQHEKLRRPSTRWTASRCAVVRCTEANAKADCGRHGTLQSSKRTMSERARHFADSAWLTQRSTLPCQPSKQGLLYGGSGRITRSASISNERSGVGSRWKIRLLTKSRKSSPLPCTRMAGVDLERWRHRRERRDDLTASREGRKESTWFTSSSGSTQKRSPPPFIIGAAGSAFLRELRWI